MKLRTLCAIFMTSLLLSACGVSLEKSPSTLGSEAGEIFADVWNSKNSSGIWPDSTALAMYCADAIYTFNPESNWSLEMQFDFTDACTETALTNID